MFKILIQKKTKEKKQIRIVTNHFTPGLEKNALKARKLVWKCVWKGVGTTLYATTIKVNKFIFSY